MTRHNRAMAAVYGRCFLALVSVFALQQSLQAVPMVYTGLVVTDVRVGKTLMHNASLKITFEGDTNDIMAVPGAPLSGECPGSGPYFFYLAKGIARMEIGFNGRTRTANLNDGQLAVTLDTCNGGIGFGSFTGPSSPPFEPAYPLAFTLGTAEFASVTYNSPLTTPSSTTGAAWSCIGYPPGQAGAAPGTSTGNCIQPDDPSSFPLKSDIGNIFVYQPYYESDGGTGIASNHSGSTNRGVFLVRRQTRGAAVTAAAPATGHGSRVVYTLRSGRRWFDRRTRVLAGIGDIPDDRRPKIGHVTAESG